jgi:hypothetical protein
MPSTSKKQHNFMAAVANNPKFAKKAGVSSSVGKEFLTADKGKTFKEGGTMKKTNPFMEMIAKKKEAAAKTTAMPMKKGGMADDAKEDMKMDKGQDKAMIKKAFKQHDAQEHKGGKGTSLKLAKGGAFRTSANGVAKKGLTKGTQVKMCGGGKMGAKAK